MSTIAYVSSVLNIHDYRFLEKLNAAAHKVYVLSIYKGAEIPQEIRSLSNLTIVHFRINTLAKMLWWLASLFLHAIALMISKLVMLLTFLIPNTFRRFLFSRPWFLRALSFHVLVHFFAYKKEIDRLQPDVIHAGWIKTDGLLATLYHQNNFQ